MSHLANPQHERQKSTLPSQPIMNPRNSQAHLVEDQSLNQCNAVHTLRSGKKVDNQVSTPPNPSPHNHTPASTSSNPKPSKSDESETDKSTSPVYKPIVPFPNRLKNNKQNPHMDKIIEIFNQVKINVPLLDAIQQVPSYAKFLKDMCTKKRKTNVPKKVFLATNISERLWVRSLSSTRIRVVPPLPGL